MVDALIFAVLVDFLYKAQSNIQSWNKFLDVAKVFIIFLSVAVKLRSLQHFSYHYVLQNVNSFIPTFQYRILQRVG